jgi:hypothetical protein
MGCEDSASAQGPMTTHETIMTGRVKRTIKSQRSWNLTTQPVHAIAIGLFPICLSNGFSLVAPRLQPVNSQPPPLSISPIILSCTFLAMDAVWVRDACLWVSHASLNPGSALVER